MVVGSLRSSRWHTEIIYTRRQLCAFPSGRVGFAQPTALYSPVLESSRGCRHPHLVPRRLLQGAEPESARQVCHRVHSLATLGGAVDHANTRWLFTPGDLPALFDRKPPGGAVTYPRAVSPSPGSFPWLSFPGSLNAQVRSLPAGQSFPGHRPPTPLPPLDTQ